jgi:hypothetical protein
VQAGPTIKIRKKLLGLTKRSRTAGGLRVDIGRVKELNYKGMLVIDIMVEPVGQPKISGGGPLCSWRLFWAGGIIFRIAHWFQYTEIPKGSK